jgi:hypothetical protein
MGWEKRGGKLVYYRKERGSDGRVRSVYCGSGERGEQAAREDEQRREGVAQDTAHGNPLLKKRALPELPATHATRLRARDEDADAAQKPLPLRLGGQELLRLLVARADPTPAGPPASVDEPLSFEEIVGRAPEGLRRDTVRRLLESDRLASALAFAGIADAEAEGRGVVAGWDLSD